MRAAESCRRRQSRRCALAVNMRALLLVVVLFGAAAASDVELPEHVAIQADAVAPEHVAVAAHVETLIPGHVGIQADHIETPVAFDEMRHMSIYGIPEMEARMQNWLSMRALNSRPMFLAVRMEGKKELDLFMLKNGFMTIFRDPKFQHMARYLLSGPEKVGLLHNAALALQIPDLAYNINNIRVSTDINPMRAFEIQEGIIPWVFIVPKSELPLTGAKLFEMGQFLVNTKGITITKEFVPSVDAARTHHVQRLVPYDSVFAATPVYDTEDHASLLSHYRAHGLHHDLRRGLEHGHRHDLEHAFRHDLEHGLHHDVYDELPRGLLPYAYSHSHRSPAYAPSYIRIN